LQKIHTTALHCPCDRGVLERVRRHIVQTLSASRLEEYITQIGAMTARSNQMWQEAWRIGIPPLRFSVRLPCSK
jgi:hypothetical protein